MTETWDRMKANFANLARLCEAQRRDAERERDDAEMALLDLEERIAALEGQPAPPADPPPGPVDPPPPPPPVDPPPPSGDAYAWGLADVDLVVEQAPGESVAAALRRMRTQAPTPAGGTVMALKLQPGNHRTLGIASGSVHAPTFVPGWWGGSELRLVGPQPQPGQENLVHFDPMRGMSGGDTIAFLNTDNMGLGTGGVFKLYGANVYNAGRTAIIVNTQRQVDMRLVGCKLLDCAAAVSAGADMKWGMQVYMCSMSMERVVAHLPATKEHVQYNHGTGLGPQEWVDVTVTGCGGQVLQMTERETDIPHDTPVQHVIVRRLEASGYHRHVGRASMALTFAGAGCRVLVEDSHLTGGTNGGLSKGMVTTWTPEQDEQSYAEEAVDQLGFGNVELTLRNSTFRVEGNADRELMNLTDCHTVRVEGCTLHGNKPVRVARQQRGVAVFDWLNNTATGGVKMYDATGADLNIAATHHLERLGIQPVAP